MDIKKMNNNHFLNFGSSNLSSNALPNVIQNLIKQAASSPSSVNELLRTTESNNKDFVKQADGFYAYKNYFMYSGMKPYFEDDFNGLEVAEKTNINSAPRIVSITDLLANRVFVVLKTEGNGDKLLPFEQKITDLSIIERLAIIDNFRRMLSHDYINQGALESTDDWNITSDNTLLLLNWRNLRRITDIEEKRSILESLEKRVGLEKRENVYSIKQTD